MNVYSREI